MAKYIVFRLHEEYFGIDVLSVQEIILPSETRVTVIPKSPSHLVGVINLRGMIVPLINLRLLLGLSEENTSMLSRVVLCKIKEGVIIGVIVDELMSVKEITDEMIDDMRSETTIIDPRHIIGVHKQESGLIVLVDIRKILFQSEAVAAGD